MTGMREDLEWTDKVHGVEARVESEEDLDLVGDLGLSILWNDCTHFAGIVRLYSGLGLRKPEERKKRNESREEDVIADTERRGA